METIGQRRAQRSERIDLVVLRVEILSALSLVGSATTPEELKQADAVYKRALSAARSVGYRPHIRAVEGKKIQVEWVAIGKAAFCETRVNIEYPR